MDSAKGSDHCPIKLHSPRLGLPCGVTFTEQQQWDLIQAIADDPVTCTASAGVFVAIRGAADSIEALIPGGMDEEKTLPLVLCLKKANGTSLVDTFSGDEPAKGENVTASAGTYKIGGTQKDEVAMYLKCREL